jgi:hypothetical protein
MRTLVVRLVGGFALAAACLARASDASAPTLEEQVRALHEAVLQMQARLDALEARLPAPMAPAPAPAPARAPSPSPAATPTAAPAGAAPQFVSPEAALRAAWSQVRPGIGDDDVLRALGEPSRRGVIDGRPVWFYAYPGLGSGSVFFTDARRVTSLQAPFGGWGR